MSALPGTVCAMRSYWIHRHPELWRWHCYPIRRSDCELVDIRHNGIIGTVCFGSSLNSIRYHIDHAPTKDTTHACKRRACSQPQHSRSLHSNSHILTLRLGGLHCNLCLLHLTAAIHLCLQIANIAKRWSLQPLIGVLIGLCLSSRDRRSVWSSVL